ncbi:MAG: two-component sensor histidine kinase [Candidatus Promineifilaceae bacterium]|jgi:two-component sensor histidine kinase
MINPLRQIAGALNKAGDLATTLNLISQKTTEVLAVDSCSIYLLDPDKRTLRLRASTGLNEDALGRGTLQIGQGMTGQAVQEQRPIYSSAAQQNRYFMKVVGAGEMIFKSLLAVPLTLGVGEGSDEETIGALNVQTLETHDFSQDEIDLVSLIGDLAAGVLYRTQLFDQQKRQLNELQGLAQVSEAVTSPKYLDDMLDVVTDMASRMLRASVCTIYLIDESRQFLELRSARRYNANYQKRAPLKLDHGIMGEVVKSGQSIAVANVQTDKRYASRELAAADGLVSMLAEPLSVRGRVIGVIACYTKKKTTFTKQQRSLIATLANQTALAIENAQLITNAAVVKEMHHRIKNNLQTVAMLMRLQMSEANRWSTREVLEMSISRIQSIATVHEVLSERGFKLVDVQDVLRRLAAGAITAPEQHISIIVSGEDLALPSRLGTAVALVVNELIQNSIEHGFAGQKDGAIQITISHSLKDVIISVRDDGIGLPQEMDRNLGLELVETLSAEDLKGSVTFRAANPGTEVMLQFPNLAGLS